MEQASNWFREAVDKVLKKVDETVGPAVRPKEERKEPQKPLHD